MSRTLRVGTRGSPLALAQTAEAIERLRASVRDVRFESLVIKTHGDQDYRRDLGTPLDGKRVFTKGIEDALLDGRIDFAVHSLKDLPAKLVDGLVLAAVPPRGDPRDLFVANDSIRLDSIPAHTRVGTSSVRRRAQLLARWPELDVIDLRGNVGTRLRRLGAKEFDAIVVAAAGVERLKIRGWPAEPLPPDVMTPAPGQGALALEARADDGTVLGILASADDPAARTATQAERALSVLVGADCNVPFGALATVEDASIALRAVVAAPDGRRVVRAVAKGPAMDWGGVVDEARGRLFDGGAREILREMA